MRAHLRFLAAAAVIGGFAFGIVPGSAEDLVVGWFCCNDID